VGTSTGAGQATVTVVATTAKVTGISVTPSDVSVTPDQEVQASANVQCTNCNNTTDKAVTWSSLSTAIATVDAGGKIKGVAVGSAVIKATSNLDASYSAAIAVTVVPAAAKATVSIQSITVNNGFNEVPANLANVFGQMNVTLNLDRGDETVLKVQVFMDTQTGDSLVAEQVYASASAIAASAGVESIKLSINTAYFGPVSGAPAFINREHTLKAKVVTLQNAQGSASNSVKLTLNNSDTFGITTVVTNGSTATDVLGQLWQTGDLEITALPIIYSTASPTIQQVVLTPSGFSGAPAVASRTLTASPYKATWLKANLYNAGTGTKGSGGIEVAGGVATNGFILGIAATLNGNPMVLPPPAFTGVRLDNKAPASPTFWANPNIRQNGWINGAVLLNASNASDPDGWLVNPANDAGVGGRTKFLRIGDGTAGTVAAALAAVASSSAALPAPSGGPTSYCAIATARDLLDNESALPAPSTTPCALPPVASDVSTLLSTLLFGVDIAPPTIAFSGGLTANQRINTPTVGAQFQVTVADLGAIGNSGMLSNSAVVGTVTIRNVAGTSCLIGATAVTTCDTPVSVNAAPPFPLVPTTVVGGTATTGYYTYTAYSQDAAGNKSATVTMVIAHDDAVNLPSLTTASYFTPLSGGAVAFNANSSDNFDLWKATYTLTFGGGLAGPVRLPDVILNTFNAPTLLNSNVPAGITLANFVRQVQAVTGNAPLAAAGGAFKPTALTGFVLDAANTTSAPPTVTLIPGASVTTGVSYLGVADPNQQVWSWAITNAAANISGGFPAPALAPVNPLAVTVNADVLCPTANCRPAPFARVDFYVLCQVYPGATCTAGQLYQVGSTASFSLVDNGVLVSGSKYTYSFSWTPGTTFGAGLQSLYALGVNAAGDGLVSPVSSVITVTNP
jgi:copper chaperone CopZ